MDETAIEARTAVAEKDEDVDILTVEHTTFASSDEEPLDDELVYLPTEPLLDQPSEDEVENEPREPKRKVSGVSADGEVRRLALQCSMCRGGIMI